MKILNIFGGPGTGKSTTAAGVFSAMKMAGYEVELVTEYAKDMTWEGRFNVLEDQLYILAKQNRRINRLKEKVDWVVTDSPILLGLMYMPKDYFKTFEPFVMEVWHSYENESFLLGRDFEYRAVGRNQNADEALGIDKDLYEFITRRQIPYTPIINNPDVSRVDQILNLVRNNK